MGISKDIIKFAKASNQKVELVRRRTVIKLFTAVILDTPVDKGLLRGNWQTSLRKPKTNNLKRKDKSGDAAIRKVLANLGDGSEDVYLTNNLPYARVAEYGEWKPNTEKVNSAGYSKKAKKGMVRVNLARAAELLRDEINNAKR